MTNCKFAQVSLDVRTADVDRLFTYRIPEGQEPAKSLGRRVYVPVRDSLHLGVVLALVEKPVGVDEEKVKEIHSYLDDFPVLTPETTKLACWMQEAYYTTISRCVRAIAPPAKKDGAFQGARGGKSKNAAKEKIATPPQLTPEQAAAYSQIGAILDSGKSPTVLLHGVTGSGKTELYFKAIERTLMDGRDSILLVPEIALAPQMSSLFYERFGPLAAVTHSRLTHGERFAIWKKALDGEIKIVIGPRSAVFTPFANLGLVVIDEEHVDSYHSEQTPKYDARQIAIKRAEHTGAACIFGSATPSLESYKKAVNKEYFLVKLEGRISKTLPEIRVVDMREEQTKGNMSMFSGSLLLALDEAFSEGKQAILFLNRRGYSSFVSCRRCGNVLQCEACRVNYTYHAADERLWCHYCGRSTTVPRQCLVCNSEHIKKSGIGTQKVEEEILKFFPGLRVLRMDLDTTKGKFGHEKILNSFRKGEASCLIGTQMVSKGLDFPQVTVVGVLAADMSLYTNDFRSGEHTFQLLTQVAGRAGRSVAPGFVYIQTASPEHYAVKLATTGSFELFFEYESKLRFACEYPPYSSIFLVMATGPVETQVIAALRKLVMIMEYACKKDSEKHKGVSRFEVIGMSPAFVSKINRVFRWKILVKSKEEKALTSFVLYTLKKLKENEPLKDISFNLSLNPVMME